MPQQIITGGDGTTGQTGEEVKDMINENFTELYGLTEDASDTSPGVVELATSAETIIGTNTVRAVTPAGAKAALDFKAPLASPTFTGTVSGITKSMVGLGSVDNTADADKPVSTAQATSIATKQSLVNSATALVDGATIDLTAIKHTLASSAGTRTFTISYTGDDITLEVTLSNTAATYTFPATSLCVTEGVASGDNTMALAGVSGDKYIIGIKKVGSAYYVASKNFGQ
jgi:hypothetical protein